MFNVYMRQLLVLILFVTINCFFAQAGVLTPGKAVKRSGKLVDAPQLKSVFTKLKAGTTLDAPKVGEEVLEAIQNQQRLLEIRRKGNVSKAGDLKVSKADMKRTVKTLELWSATALIPLEEYFEVHQIKGNDNKGHVNFTSYYAPVVKVRSTPNETYKYAFYKRPDIATFPNRASIELDGVLKGRGLELAYAKSPVDVYMMQLQGSGYVEFENGKRQLFAFGGTNKKGGQKISRLVRKEFGKESKLGLNKLFAKYPERLHKTLCQNQSYVFFEARNAGDRVKGAGHVPLLPKLSFATDPRYFPLGACMMAAVPQLNRRGDFIGHKLQFAFAQDTGGAIKGAGHVDVYEGVGKKARKRARLNHYGFIWMLIAKKEIQPTV